MDPIANLQEQIELAKHINRLWDECGDDGTLKPDDQAWLADAAERLADLVLALDGWITNGGYLPTRWQKGQAR